MARNPARPANRRRDESSRSPIERLESIEGSFDPAATAEKLSALRALPARAIKSIPILRRLHRSALFLAAFPDNAAVERAADQTLRGFAPRVEGLSDAQRERLDDSGLAGTPVRFEFPFETAARLAARRPARLEIDWENFDDTEALDRLLAHLIFHAEQQAFDDGEVSTRDWIRLAKGGASITDLRWLLAQLDAARIPLPLRSTLYDAAGIPLRWDLAGEGGSITLNRAPRPRDRWRRAGFRRPRGGAPRIIARPFGAIQTLGPALAERYIDAATDALAARQREVHALRYANPREVYRARFGRGAELIVVGVAPAQRLALEGNYGYMLFSSGVPIGYGGVSPLFHQANTGINIFEPFRGGESAWLWVQTLRAFRALFGVRRFVVNPYQIGEGNREAIGSGAFWFYYRLGFRPVDEAVRSVAAREHARLKTGRGARTARAELRELASCDLHLTLPGSGRGDYFEESWLGRLAEGATARIAATGCLHRRRALDRLAREVARKLGIKDRRRWTPAQRESFARMAPLAALAGDVGRWPAKDRRALAELMRRRFDPRERPFLKKLRDHPRLQGALAAFCRDADRAR